MYDVEIIGLDKQIALLDRYDPITSVELLAAMQASVIGIAQDASAFAPRFTGRLAGSMTSRVEDLHSSVVGVVFSASADPIYPLVMEYGRRPGAKMPPVAAIQRWSDAVVGIGLAFVIARSIARKGIKARRFLKRAYEQNKTTVRGYFEMAVERIAEKLSVHGG